jgi:hypothetical protein
MGPVKGLIDRTDPAGGPSDGAAGSSYGAYFPGYEIRVVPIVPFHRNGA